MSFFRKLVGVAAPIVGGIFGGPAGAALGSAIGGAIQKTPATPALSMTGGGWGGGGGDIYAVGARTPGGPIVGRAGTGGFGPLQALPGAIGYGAGVVVGRARSIARGAAALCNKHPQWCTTIGGIAGVAALMESGQLPVPKRRRGRGLTPRDLRSFRRVASLVRGFCPTVRRIPSRQLHARRTAIVHA